jgi:hypothetical protein
MEKPSNSKSSGQNTHQGAAHSSPRKGDGEGAWLGGDRPSTGASLPPLRQVVAWEHAKAVEAGTSRQE